MLSGTYITDIGDINASSGVYKRVVEHLNPRGAD